jgi:hypothetical protein
MKSVQEKKTYLKIFGFSKQIIGRRLYFQIQLSSLQGCEITGKIDLKLRPSSNMAALIVTCLIRYSSTLNTNILFCQNIAT